MCEGGTQSCISFFRNYTALLGGLLVMLIKPKNNGL
jgi:hypothetical protein